jgi:putative ABC transport system permease protein
VERNQVISTVRTMQQTAFSSPQRRRTFVVLIEVFGVTAVVLAVVGIYGVMAHFVTQRSNEFGIRIALGANPRQIRGLVIRHGGVLIGTGLFSGVAVALALTRVIRSLLFGASATDPLTFFLGVIGLGGVALLACYIPAWRASRTDALAALRR